MQLCPDVKRTPLYKNYLRYCHNVQKFSVGGPIPKKLHFIWVGGPLPEKFKPFIRRWKQLHPKWEFKLWTDKDINTFPWINKKAFDTATNLGMKSDIWRYEILYQYGGVYLDVDFFPLKPFDDLMTGLDLFLGMSDKGGAHNSLIGSIPKHELLDKLIKTLGTGIEDTNRYSKVLSTTGPVFLESVLFPLCKKFYKQPIVFFPNFYFYPVSENSLLTIPHPPCQFLLKDYPSDRLYAVHYWGQSWAKGCIRN